MGILIATLIITLWLGHLMFCLSNVNVAFNSILMYLHLFIQAYLFTGLFITGHDSMHGSISKNKIINNSIGWLATFLFAGLSYNRLIKNHRKHHSTPAEEEDPDFYTGSQNFWIWWLIFMKRYSTLTQVLIMAIFFNVLKIWFNESSIWVFWVIPAFLGTLQLFYFGTYRPHKYPHTNIMLPHKARTLRKNHLWAMISCYFFGYHFEHHSSPGTPWWQLYKMK